MTVNLPRTGAPRKISPRGVSMILRKVRKEDLPEELGEQRLKKAKTKVSIFSAICEWEATDLALGLGAMLGRHVDLD
ncbi:hypothetical protein NFI96_005313 [Prochilodus magdalenae]|nr:hypothetical protein NFI96_005313 [Prochilodus magdalenae]